MKKFIAAAILASAFTAPAFADDMMNIETMSCADYMKLNAAQKNVVAGKVAEKWPNYVYESAGKVMDSKKVTNVKITDNMVMNIGTACQIDEGQTIAGALAHLAKG